MTQKSIEYLQDPVSVKNLPMSGDNGGYFRNAERHRIHPNEELLIKVSSFDDNSFNYFNIQGANNSIQASNELSLNVITYYVDVDGYIDFPIIGKIKLAGMTLDEAKSKIEVALSSYFDQPNVQVKFAYKKVSILGEVRVPGYYTYTKDQLTILEALAMARDLTIHGNRKEVLIIRKDENNNSTKFEVDLTKDSNVFGYNYYIQPGDVIYIKPRKTAKWNILATPITLAFSTITTALLVYNAINQ